MTNFVYFTHSIVSCWNHGNAHFLRGVLRDLLARGHRVSTYEPADGWSRTNLLRENPDAPERFKRDFSELSRCAHFIGQDVDMMLDGADVVLVHEWTDPALIAAIGGRRKRGGRFRLLFHDTHHRGVSDPDAIDRLDLSGYDAVLAFGESLAHVYRRRGWGSRVFVWHEAADTRLFVPPAIETPRRGIVWIGNWGDQERSDELKEYLLQPAAALDLPLDVYGVRYPPEALATLKANGARYRGWLPNAEVPSVFARHSITVHVPRRPYTTHLPGIPTIRVFEALACGIPLVSAPWLASEALFQPGRDFLMAHTPAQMHHYMRALAVDGSLRHALIEAGLATIRARHTCTHRVDELLGIVTQLGIDKTLETA